jgi:hypothetical protein
MPPLKEALSRNFSRNTSGLLTSVGHGRLLVIGDSSLDPPDNALDIAYYLGNSRGDISGAAAFSELAAACPIDMAQPVIYMKPDADDEDTHEAPIRNANIIENLGFKAVGYVKDGEGGFYERAQSTDPTRPPIYLLTASAFAYDCIALTIGHLQS